MKDSKHPFALERRFESKHGIESQRQPAPEKQAESKHKVRPTQKAELKRRRGPQSGTESQRQPKPKHQAEIKRATPPTRIAEPDRRLESEHEIASKGQVEPEHRVAAPTQGAEPKHEFQFPSKGEDGVLSHQAEGLQKKDSRPRAEVAIEITPGREIEPKRETELEWKPWPKRNAKLQDEEEDGGESFSSTQAQNLRNRML